MKMILRLITRKLNKYFTALTFVIIIVYLLLLFYLVYFEFSQKDHILSSYMQYSKRQNMYDSDVAASHLHQSVQTCSEQRNFVFIKGMKCATSTLYGMFYRFGYIRNLSFVIPNRNYIYLNWPFLMTMQDFRPSSHGYNILINHAIYTEGVMETIMPKGTVYISIIREPFAQFKSIFQYFNIAKIAGISENFTNPIIEYLTHLEKYESAYKSHEAKERWCIPDDFSITKNIMSHCHGMPVGFPPGSEDISGNNYAVDRYIQHLDSKFSLIMIVEHLYESLILLRRLMCWSFEDIIFANSNIADYSFKYSRVPKYVVDIHRYWSSADYRLYHYFNNTLWKRISNQSSDFFSEVKAFKLVEEQIQRYCLNLYKTFERDQYPENMTEIVIEASPWNDKFTVTSKDCWMLGPDHNVLNYYLQKENDVMEADLLVEQNKILDMRTIKVLC